MKRFCTLILHAILLVSFFHIHAYDYAHEHKILEGIHNTPRQATLDLFDHIRKNTYRANSSTPVGNDPHYWSAASDKASVHVSKAAAVFGIFGIFKYVCDQIQNKKPEYQDIPPEAKSNFARYKIGDFKSYFECYFNRPTAEFLETDHHVILQQYALYQFVEFIRYIRILPKYRECIHEFERLCSQSSLQKNMPALFDKSYRVPILKENKYTIACPDSCETIETEIVENFLDLVQRLDSQAHTSNFNCANEYYKDKSPNLYRQETLDFAVDTTATMPGPILNLAPSSPAQIKKHEQDKIMYEKEIEADSEYQTSEWSVDIWW